MAEETSWVLVLGSGAIRCRTLPYQRGKNSHGRSLLLAESGPQRGHTWQSCLILVGKDIANQGWELG